MVLLEGDGIVESLFHMIWRKDTDSKQELLINLPDTILFRNRQPSIWYFSTKKGIILKKSSKNMLLDVIEKEFLRRKNPSGVVASYTYRNDQDTMNSNQEDKFTIQYFDEASFSTASCKASQVIYQLRICRKVFILWRQTTERDFAEVYWPTGRQEL